MTVDPRTRRVRWSARRGRRWVSVFAALTFALGGGFLQAPAVVAPSPLRAAVVSLPAASAEAPTEERSVAEPTRPAAAAVVVPLWTVSDAAGDLPAGVVPATAGPRAPPAG